MNIFVARLSPHTTKDSLIALFEQYGSVASAKVIFDRQTSTSKCFGYVEMSYDQEASEAINDSDGLDYEGSIIVVKKSHPKNSRSDQNRPPY